MKKAALIILDGFGINTKTPEENAIILAETPVFDRLFENLYTTLDASGNPVGLPIGQMGNSEVGHLTLGAGRILRQSLVKIDNLLTEGNFYKIETFQKLLGHVEKNDSSLHIMGLFGPGGVHASQDHMNKILKLIPSDIKVYIHLFGDGRDLPPKSMLDLLTNFTAFLPENASIATLGGRFYGMDRDNNWERVQKSYEQIAHAYSKTDLSPVEYVKKSYEDGINDEFIVPVSFGSYDGINDGDAVLFINFRSDRAKQLTKVFVDADFNSFETKEVNDLYFITMTKYYPEYSGDILVEDDNLKNILPEIISNLGMKQLHIAETEKFAHVTKFFNGGKQIVFNNEQDILIPSHKVETYDMDPAMSANEICQAFVENYDDHEFTVINFANGDMVGHTGDMEASKKAVEKLDEVVGKIIEFSKVNNIDVFITADHGNCEEMGTFREPKTSHSTNLVPFWYISNGEVIKTAPTGGLADVAPTIMKAMGLNIPVEMNGKPLI